MELIVQVMILVASKSPCRIGGRMLNCSDLIGRDSVIPPVRSASPSNKVPYLRAS